VTTQIKQRRDTAANWASNNPTMGVGEVGWETDTRKAKLGDGATAWNALSYIVAPDSSALNASTSFAGDASGLYNALVVDRLSGDINFPGDGTITDVGTLSDYSLGGTVGVLRWNGASALTLTGMQGGADGRAIFLVNVTSGQTLTLSHDATSTAANRFYLPGSIDYVVPHRAGLFLIYDTTLSRWVALTGRQHAFSVGGLLEGAPPSNGSRKIWTAPFACVLTDIQALVTGGTNAVINAAKNGTDFRTADATVSAGTDYASVGGTLQVTSVAIGDDIAIELVSTSGAVTQVGIQLNFTRVV
jgi:hypothetical protein